MWVCVPITCLNYKILPLSLSPSFSFFTLEVHHQQQLPPLTPVHWQHFIYFSLVFTFAICH